MANDEFFDSEDEELNEDSESSFSMSKSFDIEHLIFITNNKKGKPKKAIIEIESDIDVSQIISAIKTTKYPDFDTEFIKYSIENENINEIDEEVDQIYNCFYRIDECTDIKNVFFRNSNILSNPSKITLLNLHYLQSHFRFLYLDLNVLNKIKNTNEKRKYLSYYIARIYCFKNFDDFGEFVNDCLKEKREKNFIQNFLKTIIKKNNSLIEAKKTNENEDDLYIIIDNIDSEQNYKVLEKLLNIDCVNQNIKIFGIINIDSDFGKKKFFSIFNKTKSERGYSVHYLYSNNNNINKILTNQILNFFEKMGNGINILAELIQLIHFQEYVNEYKSINYEFLFENS